MRTPFVALLLVLLAVASAESFGLGPLPPNAVPTSITCAGARFYYATLFNREVIAIIDPKTHKLIALSRPKTLVGILALTSELCDEIRNVSVSAVGGAPRGLTTGLGPEHLVIADLNGDSIPDIAVANRLSNTVSVFLGNASGAFGSAITVATGTRPVRIAAGDVNGDGTPDLITANTGNGTTGNLSLLIGNGNGTFQPAVTIPAGTLPVDVALADLNGDTTLDLVVADGGAEAVVVLLGNGNGTFQSPASLPGGLTTSSVQRVLAVDVNHDGALDLVINGAVRLGNGNGTFQAPLVFAAAYAPTSVQAADLDGDGVLDLATTSSLNHTASVLIGHGDGTFAAPRHYVAGNTAGDVQIVDVDGSGTLDLVVSNFSDDHLSILYGRGEGTLQGDAAISVIANLANRLGANGVAVADFTGDGVRDIVVASPSPVLLPGVGLGRFGPPVAVPGLVGERVITANWNGDTKPDIALVGTALQVAMGTGNGAFALLPPFALPAGSSSFARFPVALDFNGDGLLDIAVANPGADSVSLFVNTGGNFAAQTPLAVGRQPTWLAAADLNGDGLDDLVVVNRGDFGQGNGSIAVFFAAGGTFVAGPVLRSGIEPDSVAIGDLNGDGRLDIAAVVQIGFDWSVNVFFGTPGGFSGAVVVDLPQDLVTGIRLADLDLDGRLDIVVSADGTKLALLRNRGDGSFDPPVLVDAGGGSAIAADLNRDGRPDLVVATQVGLVTVLLNATPVPGAPGTIASILPSSRAVQVGTPATVFATVLNPSSTPFSGCDIAPVASLPATFLFQTTAAATNVPTGTPNTKVGIAAGGQQTFVLAFTPQAPFAPVDVELAFSCDGVIPASRIPGVNTLTLSASATPGPDLIALAASATPGRLVVVGAGAFAVATANVGAAGNVTVAADTGGASLPLALSWCQTNPASGVCLSGATSSPLAVAVGAGATPTFAVFAGATGPLPFDPAANRVFFRVRDGAGHVIGATSVAVTDQP